LTAIVVDQVVDQREVDYVMELCAVRIHLPLRNKPELFNLEVFVWEALGLSSGPTLGLMISLFPNVIGDFKNNLLRYV
jgi:hypothetical protein